jgi:2-methylisocitrate lyase-like PEP mutase family enzyme
MRSQAAALKALLEEPRLPVMPGCGDGMGARLIEEAGFRTGFVSGSSVSAMRLAMPDMDLVSFNEMADAVESCIAAALNVLWLADGRSPADLDLLLSGSPDRQPTRWVPGYFVQLTHA